MSSSQPILFHPDSPVILPFEEVERQTLAHALKVMDNNVTKAAQALKIDRSTLYRKLKLCQTRRVGLSPPEKLARKPTCHHVKT